MVPSNLKVLAKLGLSSNCSQNSCKCSHARIFVKIPCRVRSVSIICNLKTKTDAGNNVSRGETCMQTCMHGSEKVLPRFDDVY